jgi:rhomboid protease GluP
MFKQSHEFSPVPGQALRWGEATTFPYPIFFKWLDVAQFNWDWPRWITSCFLHGGIIHIAFNMLALVQLGPVLEGLYGRSRFFVVYILSGFSGMAATICWHWYRGQQHLVLGASGAIFGLIGLGATRGLLKGGRQDATFRRQFVTWAIYGFIMSALMPGVDNIAHAGGFLGGAVVGLFLGMKHDARRAPDWLWGLVELGVFAVVVYSVWHVHAEVMPGWSPL